MTVLKYGDRGPSVVALQQRLLSLGFSVGSSGVDGVFGVDTRAAVAAFQRANGVFPADGMVNAKTQIALNTADFVGPSVLPGTSLSPFEAEKGFDFDWRLGVALGGFVLFGLMWWAGGKR